MEETKKEVFNRGVAELVFVAYFMGGGKEAKESYNVATNIVDVLENIPKKNKSAA